MRSTPHSKRPTDCTVAIDVEVRTRLLRIPIVDKVTTTGGKHHMVIRIEREEAVRRWCAREQAIDDDIAARANPNVITRCGADLNRSGARVCVDLYHRTYA